MGDTIDSIFRNIILLLRYVFPPIIGFLIVFVGYEYGLNENNSFYKLMTNHVSLTLLVTIAFGLTIFHIHRAIIHHIPSYVVMSIVRHIFGNSFWKPKIQELNFARWIRRCPTGNRDGKLTKKAAEARAIQNALDIANAGAHFLYCSCWSAFMWRIVFSCYPTEKCFAHSLFFWLVISGLLLSAIVSEFWTSVYDLKVYNDYKAS